MLALLLKGYTERVKQQTELREDEENKKIAKEKQQRGVNDLKH